jgi:multidrug efflux system membrane fusion protein
MNQNVPTAPPEQAAPPLPSPRAPQANPPRRSRRGWIWLVLLAAAAIAAYYYWPKGDGASGATATPTGGASGKKGGRGGGIPPVVVSKATRGNIGVYFTGLGNVTPIYTVTEHTLVNGQLMNVFFKEGDTVQKDQQLAQIDPRPYQVQLEQAEGQLVHDQALLDNARVDQKRYETLLAQNAVPEQTLATQKALVAQYEGTVKADQGMIDSAKLNLVYCDIRAKITGRVGLRLVDPGNIVHATDSNGLLVITQVDPISIIFTVAEGRLPAVMDKLRQHQTLRVDAYNADESKKLATGTLTTIDNQIDQTTGSVRLRATFDNKDNVLFPNEMVNARLLVEEKRNVVLLSTAAVQRTTNSQYVFLVKPDNTVTVRTIAVGTTEGDQTEITSGLAAGDVVVMTGVDKLNEGTKVNPQFANAQGQGRGGAGAGNAPAGTPGTPAANAPSGTGSKKGAGSGPKQAGGGKSKP